MFSCTTSARMSFFLIKMVPVFLLLFFKFKVFFSQLLTGDSIIMFLEVISSWKHSGLNSVSERQKIFGTF